MKIKKVIIAAFCIAAVLVLAACTAESTDRLEKELTNAINDYIGSAAENIAQSANDRFNDVKEEVADGLTDAGKEFNQAAGDGLDSLGDSISEIGHAIKEDLKDSIEEITTGSSSENRENVSDNNESSSDNQENEPVNLENDSAGQENEAVNQEVEQEEQNAEYVEYRFRSKKLLNQHYDKHGRDMGFKDAASYEKAASDVVNNPKALHKIEKEDGDYVFYVEDTNEFVIVSTDGYLRTYFLPDAGKKYYDRQ